MAERVHPQNDDASSNDPNTTPSRIPTPNPTGTYVIQIPKDQVYRIPPPENAKRFETLTRRSLRRHSPFRRCLCCSLSILLFLLLSLAIAAAILYLVFRPKSPSYTIQSISIKNLNFTSLNPISPEFDVSVRSVNPNKKIGIYYLSGSSVSVYYNDVKLSSGSLPVFYQGTNNVTIFELALTGSGIELTNGVKDTLSSGVSNGSVPFNVKLRAPVKFKVGAVKTWKITVKVNCDVTVNKLTSDANIVSKSCDYGVDIW